MAKYFKREIGLIIFMYLLMIYELKFSKPISSSPKESEFYFKSEIGALFIIIAVALLSAYFQLTCIAFEGADFVSKDPNGFIFDFSALSVFLIFVLRQAKITKSVRIEG